MKPKHNKLKQEDKQLELDLKTVKEKAFAFDEVGKQRRIEVIQLGQEIGKNIFTTKGGRLRNPDADPENALDIDYNPNNDELAPCFHCNI